MTKIKYLIVMLTFSLTIVLLFNGNSVECSSINDKDAKDVVSKAYQKYSELKSYHMTIDSITSLSVQGKSIDVITKIESDVHIKPMILKNITTITLDTNSQKSMQKLEQYGEETGGQFTVYSNIHNQWVKQYISNYNPLFEYDNYFKAIKSVIPIRDAGNFRVYEVIVDGSYLRENMGHALAPSAATQAMILPEEVYKNLGDFKYTITIDKKTSTISKIDIDLTELLSTIGQKLTETKDVPAGQKSLTLKVLKNMKVRSTITFSKINSVAKVSIPQEALNAPVQKVNGFVDISKVMKQSPYVKANQIRLNQRGQELTNQLKEDMPKLTKEQFRQKQNAAYQEFLNTKQAFEQEIHEVIRQAVSIVVKEKYLMSVTYKNSDSDDLPAGSLDITEDVIQRMEETRG